MEQAVSRRKKKIKIIIVPTYNDSRAKIVLWNRLSVVMKEIKIIIVPTYDDSRAKIALWNDPLDTFPHISLICTVHSRVI